jgi:hypothetical protein
LPTREPLVSQIEMEDLPRASRTQKVPLSIAAIVASIAHELKHLRPAVDDDADLFAREGRERRGG